MSLAKFRKVFKGHKKPSTPSPKVSPDNTDNKQQDDKQAPSRISSVVEQRTCNAQVLSSILRSGSSSSQRPFVYMGGNEKIVYTVGGHISSARLLLYSERIKQK